MADPATPLFDGWINFPSETGLAPDPNIAHLFKDQAAGYKEGYTVEQIVEAMDANGVAGGLLTRVERRVTGPFIPALDLDDEKVSKACAEVRAVMEQYPGRFLGSILLDPRLGYAATRHVRIAVQEYGLSAIRVMPAFALLPPNDALYYPLYTTACDLGIPVTINVGMPGPHKPAMYQHPMHLDEVALAFPDLKIVMTHVGDPWACSGRALGSGPRPGNHPSSAARPRGRGGRWPGRAGRRRRGRRPEPAPGSGSWPGTAPVARRMSPRWLRASAWPIRSPRSR